MNLQATVELFGYGTSEGAIKAWDTRGRKSFEVSELRETAPSGAKTGTPISFGAFHNSNHPNFVFRGRAGDFFAQDATPEFGDHTYHVTLSFKNPLVAESGIEAAKVLGRADLSRQYDSLLTGVDKDDNPLMGDLTPLWHKADGEMAKAARAAGYDGILYSGHDDLNPVQYQVLDKSVVSGVRKIGQFDSPSGKIIR